MQLLPVYTYRSLVPHGTTTVYIQGPVEYCRLSPIILLPVLRGASTILYTGTIRYARAAARAAGAAAAAARATATAMIAADVAACLQGLPCR